MMNQIIPRPGKFLVGPIARIAGDAKGTPASWRPRTAAGGTPTEDRAVVKLPPVVLSGSITDGDARGFKKDSDHENSTN